MGAGSVIKGVAPVLSAVPYVGPILSMAATIGGGALEASEAEKQKEQAEKIRNDAKNMKPQAIQDEYLKSLRMDKMAAISGMPALEYDKSQIENNTARTLRSIQESSPSGAATLAAMGAAKALESNSLSDILAKNEAYKANANVTLSNALKGIGGEKQSLQDKMNEMKKDQLRAASGLEAAGTYNKMQGINKILGAAGSTASSLFKQVGDGKDNNDELVKKIMAMIAAQKGGVNTDAQAGASVDANNVWNYQPNITPDYVTAPTAG